jgi:hypothetical protein
MNPLDGREYTVLDRRIGNMITVVASILIYRPVTQVFDFVSASANDFEWQYGTLASGPTSDGTAGVGASFRSIGHLMGRRMHRTFSVTEYQTNRQYGFKSLTGPLQSHTLYTLEAADGGTSVHVSTDALPVNALQLREADLQKHMQKQLNEDLLMLKSLLETGAARPVAGLAAAKSEAALRW